MTGSVAQVHLSGITVYPVKSCAGIAVADWPVIRSGLAHDRSYMVVTADGRFLTQREQPRLALVRPRLSGAELRLTVAGVGEVGVPLQPAGAARHITVWEHTGPALDSGDEAAELLSEHLGLAVRLVGLAPAHARDADPEFAPPGVPVGFVDGFPLLVIGAASLVDLNSRLPHPLAMTRFRPNLVVAGATPYAEDGWRRVAVGDTVIEIVKPCARCAITTVDPDTGERTGAEPLRALGTYRRGRRGVEFGQNAVPLVPGTLRVGDAVTPEPDPVPEVVEGPVHPGP